MNDCRLAIVKMIIFDFNESPYSDFEKYWYDHETHYLILLGDIYNQTNDDLVKLGHLLE